MHIKTAPRARLLSSTSLFPMLRGPNVFYSEGPDPTHEPAPADDTPEEFREQPGDREPDPEAPPEPEPAPEGDADAEGDPPEGEEGEGDPPEGEAAPEGEEPPEGEAPPQKKDWKDRQIAKLREREAARDAELAEAKRRADAAEALLAAAPEERDAATVEQTREAIRREEAAKLEEAAYYKRINSGLEAMDEAGKKGFAATWDARITQAREVFRDELVARPDFLEAVTDLPNAAAVYHELAGDPDKMEALLAMKPHKMGMELAQMSAKLAKPPARQVSRVPAPITPIGRGGGERTLEELLNDPNADMAEIDRRMAAEEKKRERAN